MLMFTLAISCLTTSNLPWFMDLTFQVPVQCCSLLNFTSIMSHIHNWALFLLWLHLFILFGVISPLFSSSIWTPTDQGSSPFSVISFCLFILFMGFSIKNTEVVFHSLLQWTTFWQNSPPCPFHLGCPYTAWLTVDSERWTPQVSRCPICYYKRVEK